MVGYRHFQCRLQELMITQSLLPDQFFDADQQRRLSELMSAWRQARDTNTSLPPDEQNELDALIETELCAAGRRAAWLFDEAKR